jgi:hypothetical protein
MAAMQDVEDAVGEDERTGEAADPARGLARIADLGLERRRC